MLLQDAASANPSEKLLHMNNFWNLMHTWSRISRASFRTNLCPPLLWSIYHLIHQVFQQYYQLKFHHRNISQFQFMNPVNLQVLNPQAYHKIYHLTCPMMNLPQIQFLIQATLPLLTPVFLLVRTPQVLHHHSQPS